MLKSRQNTGMWVLRASFLRAKRLRLGLSHRRLSRFVASGESSSAEFPDTAFAGPRFYAESLFYETILRWKLMS